MTDEMAPVITMTTNPRRIPFQINDTVFQAWKIPGITFLKLLSKLNEQTTGQQQAEQVFLIFQQSMTPEEYERFLEFATDPSNGLDTDTLVKLIQSLVEHSGDRPTEPPSSSENGQSSDSPTSEGAS